MREVRIELELPPKELMPNSRPHRMAKARAVKEYRAASQDAAFVSMGTDGDVVAKSGFPWDHATAQVFWRHSSTQPDRDNALAALKAAFDGIADSGVIGNDRELIHLPMKMQKVERGLEGVHIVVKRICGDACPLCEQFWKGAE